MATQSFTKNFEIKDNSVAKRLTRKPSEKELSQYIYYDDYKKVNLDDCLINSEELKLKLKSSH